MAASPQLEALQALLRKQGLGGSLPKAGKRAPAPAPTGFTRLDALLGGGLPRGQITELAGPASSGRTSVMLSLLAEATSRGEVAAYIDATDCFDPVSAEKAGVVLERLLWVRCGSGEAAETRERRQDGRGKGQRIRDKTGHGMPCPYIRRQGATETQSNGTTVHGSRLTADGLRFTAHDLPWKALNLVVSAGGFGVIVLDLGEISRRRLRSWQSRPWMRLLHMVRGSSTAAVVLTPAHLASSISALVLELSRKKAHWAGTQGVSLLLDGISTQVRVAYQRRRVEQQQEHTCELELEL